MDNRSIGVFDSGLGGLTTVKQIMKRFPNESIIYFGDTGRVPYGTRSDDTIIKYARDDIRFLMSHDVKMIVIACGTVSSVALPIIRKELDVPVFGVVDAAVYEAVRVTKNKKIGIIGTSATINSGAYRRCINERDKSIKIFERACPLFVPLVENGHFNTLVTRLVIEEYLEDIRCAGVDTLIMGCTHYPLLEPAIAEFMGDKVNLISPGREVANYLAKKLTDDLRHDDCCDNNNCSYYVSDDADRFEELASIFLERKLDGTVKKIDIEKY